MARRAEKRALYEQLFTEHVKSGKPPKEFHRMRPNMNVPDPDTLVLYCLFDADLSPDEQVSATGIPLSALALYSALFEAMVTDGYLRERRQLSKEGLLTEVEFAIQWIEALRPGQDVSILTTRFVLTLLTDAQYGVLRLAMNSRVADLLTAVSQLHVRVLAGGMVSRNEWKDLRRTLAQQADELRDSGDLNDLDEMLLSFAESAATDCTTFCGIGEELVVNFARMQGLHETPQIQYSDDEEALARRLEDLRGTDINTYRNLSESELAKAIIAKKEDYAIGVIDKLGREERRLAKVWLDLAHSQ
ncbi:hypothetical protein AN416_37855 (plasmid) [Paraburkholderia caribensis]|nr:hypothetical protein AN416_37855 [Paraburkholderia caribensis]AUT57856.1 hypothetical protein C2L66_38830 [Paraburkholderia caribensis]